MKKNAHEYIESAIRYAKKISKYYEKLTKSIISGRKNNKTYKENLELLKELVEYEELFYGIIPYHTLEYMQVFMEREKEKYSSSDDDSLYIIRVIDKINFELLKRNFFDDTKNYNQSGTIPLLPKHEYDFNIENARCSSILTGLVNSYFFVYLEEYSKIVSLPTKIRCITDFSNIDSILEKYFLKNNFKINKEQLKNSVDLITDSFNDNSVFSNIASTEFIELIFPLIIDVLKSYNLFLEDGSYDPDSVMSLLEIVSFLEAVPDSVFENIISEINKLLKVLYINDDELVFFFIEMLNQLSDKRTHNQKKQRQRIIFD